ncbi:MAG: heme-binding domain-containing protein [Chloroflexi bacterium]|nr:heme-binding domain-containing protein [Chloroflexota bacterium]MDA1218150.1 heme-binding domain-containing protein [Chloroflexota bacterium]PKB57376.1 MAG: cytochrome C [SAR202 cluster bacterium Casp-Chloro-G3]
MGGLGFFGLIVIAFLAIQVVPYGRDHSNPPVRQEPAWANNQTRELAVRACYDCHSNETKWPWYSNIAPISWLVQRDVDEGRDELNFSRWDQSQGEADDAAETVIDGEMPPCFYVLPHPEADLSRGEKELLIQGLRATFGGEDRGGEDQRGRREERQRLAQAKQP